jgi:iron(II)-dependent oxidoreductase
VAKNLSEQQRQEVLRVLQEEMSPVKAGRVLLHAAGNAPESHPADVGEVGAIMIDRYAVSNAEYHEFVAAGGYEQPELWAPEIRQSLATFIDLTQHAGPRYWRNSRFAPGTADHPVVGICWFEADAYARWIGKRLPRDTEWIKAAVSARSSMISAEQLLRYPWGNAFRDDRANLWSSGKGQTVPVAEYPGGQSSDGVYQLVGNVWEWMDGELREMWRSGELLSPSQQYKTLRGGAFDTYLESQSACHMVSGDSPLARRSNIGFRCVLNASDVNLTN